MRWQAQDEEGALLRDQLKQAAHLWDEKGRTADLLWSGTAFREYELWRERYPGALTALEEDFARAMAERARRTPRLVRRRRRRGPRRPERGRDRHRRLAQQARRRAMARAEALGPRPAGC